MGHVASRTIRASLILVVAVSSSWILRDRTDAAEAGVPAAGDAAVPTVGEPDAPAAVEADGAKAVRVLERFCSVSKAELDRPGADPSDLSAAAAACGHDEQRIFEFVRDRIAVEPYRGVLRGARGTLASRAGNSLDRALLLVALLEKCGRESRIIRGNLPDPLAEKLLETFLARDPRSTPLGAFLEDGAPAGEQETLRRLCSEAGLPLEGVEQVIQRGVDRAALVRRQAREQESRNLEFLASKLAESGLDATAAGQASVQAIRDEFLDRLRSHHWVEMKGPGEDWIVLDTAFPDSKPSLAYGESPEPLEEIPADLFHRFELSLVYVSGSAEDPKEETILSEGVPTGEAPFEPLELRISPAGDLPAPSRVAAMDAREKTALLRKIKKFQASLRVGPRSYGSKVFDLEGNTFAVSGTGQIEAVSSLGGAAGGLGFGLGGDDSEAEKPRFVELRAVLELQRPGAEPIRQTRSIVRAEEIQRPGFLPPLLDWEILVQPCIFPADLAGYLSLGLMVAVGESVLDVAKGPEGSVDALDRAARSRPSSCPAALLPLVLERQAALASSARAFPGVVPLFDSANLFIASQQIRTLGGEIAVERRTDIVENAVAFIPANAAAAAPAFRAALLQGVADSVIEMLALEPGSSGPGTRSAVSVFEGARLEGRAISVVGARDADALEGLGLSEADRQWILRNEPEGNRLVVAQVSPGGAAAWWSVSPRGACLARSSGGYGQAHSDYSLLTSYKIVGWAMCLWETAKVMNRTNAANMRGAVLCWTMTGFSVGFMMAHYHGWVAWALVGAEITSFLSGMGHA